jgi:hypothetical protein
VEIVHPLKKPRRPFIAKWHPRKCRLCFFGAARKRDLMLISIIIGKLHVGMASDIQVMLFSKKTASKEDLVS